MTQDNYEAMFSLRESFGRMDGKLDILIMSQEDNKRVFTDHDSRLRSLEKTRARWVGFLTLASTLAATSAAALTAGWTHVIDFLQHAGVFPR